MKKTILYLEDILECMNKIEKYISGLNFEQFDENQLIIDAVIRNLEIIGEASKFITEEIRLKYPSVPWKSMVGLRNILIHEYFGVDEQIIWEIVSKDFKETKPIIESILHEYDK